ncbi:serine hydrolase domain-containing protein [Sunxiuqinia sp. A32]|uniref:serine hydrolase domain-containing protein n=1 Tax=Sunxiuqinia sp. A32 TaxID=3461496 RepID=UPI004045D3CC
MRNITLLLLFVLATSLAFAQTKSIQKSPPLTLSTPESVGMSSERLKRIDTLLENAIESDEIPGAVSLIARNGKIVYFKAFGKAENKTQRNFETDDIFRIASQSKAITSTAVMMLWEEGLFNLDDPISKYIPEFKNPKVLDTFNETDSSYTYKPADKEITIRHLLTHTSGIGYGFIDDERFQKIYKKAGIIEAFTTEPVLIKDNIKKLSKLPLHHNPGEKYTYSMGLDVLGYFIEVISGIPFDKFLTERIFKPLGMNDTYFYLPVNKSNRLVPVQTQKDGDWVKYTTDHYDIDYPINGAKMLFSGGGGLSSTAKDYATFLQMYLNEGELNGIRLLSRTTVNLIKSAQVVNFLDFWGINYGLAFGIVSDKGMKMGYKGSEGTIEWSGYFNTQYFADPNEHLIGILMKQTLNIKNDSTSKKFRHLVEQAIDD